MDKETRGAIEKATQRARALLEGEFSDQLQGHYNIMLSGVIEEPGGHLAERELLARDKIVASIEHKQASGMKPADAVAACRRDLAFTTLNRFAALRMIEARELIQECVSRGELSSGYKEFCGLAPGVALLPDGGGYRLYLESLFDELSTEVKVLFDRRDVAAALWPRRPALTALLEILNDPQLVTVWREDETIGWVYQYFNSAEERSEMREAQAPRDSRELAVRNQFFTPRYVVRFLVDNTLGRLWYEMRQGSTVLTTRCEHLIHRPHEVFLVSTEALPDSTAQARASDGGVILVPYRAKVDPRSLRILDPACGSAHFLLYVFDVLFLIYEEAWAEAAPPLWTESGQSLHDDYPDLDALRRALPGLILGHNLHGIDIDGRCAQIAQLALWMRAQRSFQKQGIPSADRPRIERTNIAVAEPIGADSGTVERFLSTLTPALFADLARALFERLALAGELGSLLDIDAALRDIVADAKRQYHEQVSQPGWLPGLAPATKQPRLDFRGPTGASFLDEAETHIREALERFRPQDSSRNSARWRLFASDVSQGVAFLDIARQRYDVVLMNPPFGDPTPAGRRADVAELNMAANDLGAAFVRAAQVRWAPAGFVGVLTSTRLWFKPTVAAWRKETLLGDTWGIRLGLHLGGKVLDQASVSASALVLGPRATTADGLFLRFLRPEGREHGLPDVIRQISSGSLKRGTAYFVDLDTMRQYRGVPLAYWISEGLRRSLSGFPALEPAAADVRQGTATADDQRFVRAWWETKSGSVGLDRTWAPFAKGSEYSPFWDDITWVLRWENAGAEIRSFEGARAQNIGYFGRPGVAFPIKAVLGFNPRPLPPGCAFGHVGPTAFPGGSEAGALCGYLSSRPLEYVFSFANGSLQGEKGAFQNTYDVGTAKDLPWPPFDEQARAALETEGLALCAAVMHLQDDDETTHQYTGRPAAASAPSFGEMARSAWTRRRARVAEALERRAHLDEVVSRALHFDKDDVAEMEREFAACEPPASGPWSPHYLEGTDSDLREEAAALVSELVGMAFGRFDVRIATGLCPPPERGRPFDPLPAAPPAFLNRIPDAYPLAPPKDGILVDDPGHPRDIAAAVQRVTSAIWQERADAMEQELFRALETDGLRAYFASGTGFFHDHCRRYAKARRTAPIYWRLGPASGSYSVFIYWLATGDDTLFTIQRDYVAPKLRHEEAQLEELRGQAGEHPNPAQRKALAEQQTLVEDIRQFLEELKRVGPLWRPHADDGVVINFALLWRLVPLHPAWQAQCREVWDGICAGKKYDWSHLAFRFWPERVVPRCHRDRSLAIAHGLEQELWEKTLLPKGKRKARKETWQPRRLPQSRIEELIRERTSPAVKAALNNLLEAAAPAGSARARDRESQSNDEDMVQEAQ